MVAMSDPTPNFLSYFCVKATASGKKGISGEMILVEESPILKTAWASSGDRPKRINIGTKIGAIMIHFAESIGKKRLIKAVKKIKPIINGNPTNPIF